jgi:hypothetical protein
MDRSERQPNGKFSNRLFGLLGFWRAIEDSPHSNHNWEPATGA